MLKITSVCTLIIIGFLTGCATTTPAPTTERAYTAVTPNPAVAKHPAVQSVSYDDASSSYNIQEINTYYPTGVGINVNGYGPNTAHYYEAGFFGNF